MPLVIDILGLDRGVHSRNAFCNQWIGYLDQRKFCTCVQVLRLCKFKKNVVHTAQLHTAISAISITRLHFWQPLFHSDAALTQFQGGPLIKIYVKFVRIRGRYFPLMFLLTLWSVREESATILTSVLSSLRQEGLN